MPEMFKRLEPTLERPEWVAPPQQWEVKAVKYDIAGTAAIPSGWEPFSAEIGTATKAVLFLRRRIA